MASKSKLARQEQAKNINKRPQKILAVSLGVLLFKLLILINIPEHYWLGADGENYINGLNGLIVDGIFSKNSYLSYWPAGYPILMYPIAALSIDIVLTAMVILQSVFYAFACYFFALQLLKTKLQKFAIPSLLLLSLNPTLSLSTLTIGYESISASIFLLAIGLLISDYITLERKWYSWRALSAALLFSVSSFVQPRFALSAAVFFVIWAFSTYSKKTALLFLIVGFLTISILPATLVMRNIQANQLATISTNLGITMNLGAGPGATGAYITEGYGVPCEKIDGNEAQVDAHLRNCVIKWYLNNPTKSLALFFNKAKFFWSPWSGPEATGSMARNPWLKINPLISIAKGSQEGNDLVNGSVGRVISWLWVLGSIFLLAFGVLQLIRSGGIGKIVGISGLSIVVINWLISIGTLGDHRQRLPIMTVSLFFQLIGFLTLSNRTKYRLPPEQL
jgi:hypothetical protein